LSDVEFQHDVAENFLLSSKTCTSPASASEKLYLRVVTVRFTISVTINQSLRTPIPRECDWKWLK